MPLGLQEYCALARHALDEKNQENAEKFVELALQQEGGTEHPDALEVTALLMRALGDMTSAADCMERAVDADKLAIAEEINSNKIVANKPDMVRRMLSLAEYYQGSMAFELYKTALDLSEDIQDSNKSSSMIAASIAELYLSMPLCMKPEAKDQCKKYTEICLSKDSTNVDGWSLKTSYHISAEETDLAKTSLVKCLELYDNCCKSENGEDDVLTNSQKVRLIQLCTELANYEKAVEIGENVMLLDKTQYHVLYYMGWAGSLSSSEELKEASRDYLHQAKSLLLQLKKTPDFSKSDMELIEHVDKLIEDTGGKLEEVDVSAIPDAEVEAWVESCIMDEENEMKE